MCIRDRYSVGQRAGHLNTWLFVRWCTEAMMASVFLFVVPWFSVNANPSGRIYSFEAASLQMFTLILFAVTYRIAIETQYWTWLNHLFCWGSLVLWFVYIMLECGLKYGIVTQGALYWDIFNVMSDAVFWLTLLLAPVAAVLPAMVYKVWKALYFPSDSLKVRHAWVAKLELEQQNDVARVKMDRILPPENESWELSQNGNLQDSAAQTYANPIDLISGQTTLQGSWFGSKTKKKASLSKVDPAGVSGNTSRSSGDSNSLL
eukprot:TRINITY_DN12430_c0_g1_i1.p1 TRINITY_DN12430_c0_g1~~TRINITY_DN12430_c0_g1_i1.p1  ORF type:complete len:261 (+),score=85.45 TRINITY_DN12430_c0_g1_i1:144-926(+)